MTRKIIFILFPIIFLLSCKKNDETNIVNPIATSGKIVVDTFQVIVHPTRAEYTIVYHFKDRLGIWNLFSIEAAGSAELTAGGPIERSTPFPIDSIQRLASQIQLYYTQTIDDSVWAVLRLRGEYYEQTTAGYNVCGQFDYKDSLKIFVTQ